MKRSIKQILTFILLLSFLCTVNSQNVNDQFDLQNNLSRYAKVWGLLKYYHPEIAKGKIDWDSVLVVHLPSVKIADTKVKYNSELEKLLDIAGDVEICDTCHIINNDSIKRYPDLEWVKDTAFFSQSVIERLEFIINNKYPFDNFYVQSVEGIGCTSYENEKAYSEMVYPSEEYRLLALFRYWNVINYYFPYKHLMDRKWNEVLMEFIPKFVNASDTIDYHLLVFELAANINDSHGISMSPLLFAYWGNMFLPFSTSYYESNTVITKIYKQMDSMNVLKVGDIIVKLNNKLVSELRQDWLKYFAGSNEKSKQAVIDLLLFRTNNDTIDILISRKNQMLNLKVKSLSIDELKPIIITERSSGTILKRISINIAYINLANLEKGDVDSIMHEATQYESIIFDLRGYSRNTMYQISEYLNPEKKCFTLIYSPDLDFPGVFRYTDMLEVGPDSINSNYYKGKVVVLIDINTQSHGEFACMALQTAPDVTIIGSKTSGADGNVSNFRLPGNITVRFSGIGIAYPNGIETQRIGIIPDIFIEQTIRGIINKKDDVLEKAITVLRQRNSF